MRPISDCLADTIEKYRQAGEPIAAAASRILYHERPADVDSAIREAERRERWRAGQ